MINKKAQKAMISSILILTMGTALAGCTAESEIPEKQSPAEPVKKESIQEPDVELTGRQLIFKTDTEEIKILLANAITKENEEFGLDDNNQDARTVDKVELVFYGNAAEEYIPAWYYEMADGRAYYVNCTDGQVSHP